ncbi:helix-turn-helix domain-containing protein [Paenibacillus sp. 2003]|uniref:helix-turn-helix domain-containing protein n=1 Tax=Paenibacillus sp. 2003 TaxID=2817761 RepID=UPI0037C81E5D
MERSTLEILHRQGQSARPIARERGRHASAICRELDRLPASPPYQADQNKNAYEEHRKVSSLQAIDQIRCLGSFTGGKA